MKLMYTDRQGVTYELLDAEPADLPRFVRAVRADTREVIIVHEDAVRREPTHPTPKQKD
jgi:hypothetical protein